MTLINSLLHKHRSCRYCIGFWWKLANILNKAICIAKIAQSPQAWLNLLLEYTLVLSSQSRERVHLSTPWVLINNPSPNEVEGLPFHRASLKLKVILPPFKNVSPFWEMISRKKSKYLKLLLIYVVQFFLSALWLLHD